MSAVALGAVLVLAGGVVTVGAVLGMAWEISHRGRR